MGCGVGTRDEGPLVLKAREQTLTLLLQSQEKLHVIKYLW